MFFFFLQILVFLRLPFKNYTNPGLLCLFAVMHNLTKRLITEEQKEEARVFSAVPGRRGDPLSPCR